MSTKNSRYYSDLLRNILRQITDWLEAMFLKDTETVMVFHKTCK